MKKHTVTDIQHRALKEAFRKVNPVSSLTSEENEKIQIFIEAINELFHRSSSLNRFCDTIPNKFQNKEIGIIVYKGSPGEISYSLFSLQNENDSFIRELPEDFF